MTPMQEIMLQDGCPVGCLLTEEERATAWKGKRLTTLGGFKVETNSKPTDPGTIEFIREREAAARAAAKAAKQARREAAIIRQRQRASHKGITR